MSWMQKISHFRLFSSFLLFSKSQIPIDLALCYITKPHYTHEVHIHDILDAIALQHQQICNISISSSIGAVRLTENEIYSDIVLSNMRIFRLN